MMFIIISLFFKNELNTLEKSTILVITEDLKGDKIVFTYIH